MTRRVGWIGLGDQGAPMARALAGAEDVELHVWARRHASLEELAGLDFAREASPSELVAAVDYLALCLREDTDIDELFATNELWSQLPEGFTVINHGTGLPAFARELAARAAEHSVRAVDAPVSGGRPGAEERRLLTMVGADAGVFEDVRQIFAHFSATVVRAGEAGAGQMAKLMNNALLMLNERSIQEVFALARTLELDIPALVDVIRHGTGSSVALTVLGSGVNTENAEHLSRLQVIDIDLFNEALEEAGVRAPEISARARKGAEDLPVAATAVAGS